MKIESSEDGRGSWLAHTAWGIALHHWCYLLWKNEFRLARKTLIKAFLITMQALLTAPVQAFEYLLFRRQIRKVRISRPVFIIGHYRSGTTFLHYLLSKDPVFRWCATYEGLAPNTFLTLGPAIKRFLSWAMPRARPQDNLAAGATLPIEEEFALGSMSRVSMVHGYYFPQKLFAVFDDSVLLAKPSTRSAWQTSFLFLVQKLALRSPNKRMLLKSPANTARISALLKLFPDAQFIHIHRNPYDVYRSTVRLYNKVLNILSFQSYDANNVTDFVLYAYEQMYRKFMAEKELIPKGQLLEVGYDQLVDAPHETLVRMYTQLALGPPEKVAELFQDELKKYENYERNQYPALSSSDASRIRERWGFVFDTYGYPV
jgi:hypothetical protein